RRPRGEVAARDQLAQHIRYALGGAAAVEAQPGRGSDLLQDGGGDFVAGRLVLASRAHRVPQPPPPGVSTATTWPRRSSLVAFGRNGSPSSRFAPQAPASPPFLPAGPWWRRSVRSESVAGSSTRTRRSMPSPPRLTPAPP